MNGAIYQENGLCFAGQLIFPFAPLEGRRRKTFRGALELHPIVYEGLNVPLRLASDDWWGICHFQGSQSSLGGLEGAISALLGHMANVTADIRNPTRKTVIFLSGNEGRDYCRTGMLGWSKSWMSAHPRAPRALTPLSWKTIGNWAEGMHQG